MSNTSRNRILSRLKAAPKDSSEPFSKSAPDAAGALDREKKIRLLKQRMEAMRTEVHLVDKGNWVEAFAGIVRKKGLTDLLYSPGTEIGAVLEKYWENSESRGEKYPKLISYNRNVEELKQQLFNVSAAITSSKGAIADSGAIILWPDEREPRLMSLAPPVHFVVLDADTIFNNLSEALERENWNGKMPTNALLISGPSKTADIELTLAFGVHGPKELILFVAL